MYLKYLALPLSLALVTASGTQACPSTITHKTRMAAAVAVGAPLSTPVITTTTYSSSGAAAHVTSSLVPSLAVAAVIGVAGYLWWKHEHDKALAAAAACAALPPAPDDYILKPPADPTASMTIDGIVYTPYKSPTVQSLASVN